MTPSPLKPSDGYPPSLEPRPAPRLQRHATSKVGSPLMHGLGREGFDDEGRVIVHRYGDFQLYNIYFPNGQRDPGARAL